MNTPEANLRLGVLVRRFYVTEGHTQAEAIRHTLNTLTLSEKNALLEPIIRDFIRSLDAEKDTGLVGRVRVRAGNTVGISENRSQVIRQATEIFRESKDKSFSAEVASLRDVAREPLWLGDKKWVTLGAATFTQLEQGRQYSEKIANSHVATAKKINEVQRLILKAAPSLDGEATLNKTIDFVDANGDQAEDILKGLELIAG